MSPSVISHRRTREEFRVAEGWLPGWREGSLGDRPRKAQESVRESQPLLRWKRSCDSWSPRNELDKSQQRFPAQGETQGLRSPPICCPSLSPKASGGWQSLPGTQMPSLTHSMALRSAPIPPPLSPSWSLRDGVTAAPTSQFLKFFFFPLSLTALTRVRVPQQTSRYLPPGTLRPPVHDTPQLSKPS